jgi:hypothetical protein
VGVVGTSRRDFVKLLTSSGIALSVSPLALAQQPDFMARETFPGRQNFNPAATGAGRIDGVAKVTGSKLYAADFRAADLPGWPAKTLHAMLIRATDATHIFEGFDLSRLTGALKPSVLVTAEDLARIGTRVPEFYAGDLLCPLRKTPLYLGQPIALLIFEDFDSFDQARLALRGATVVKYGEETGPLTRPPYAAFRFTRVAGATPDAPDVYSPVKNGWVSPGVFNENQHPVWERLPIATGLDYAEAAGHGEAIRAELAADNPARLVLERQFETQSADPMFLEPESGLAWYDAGRKTLELVVGVQSPYDAAESVGFLLGEADAAHKPARINTHFAYMGGGFRRTRPYAVSNVRGARGDVLPRPAGAARQQSLRAIPIGHAHGCRSGHRQDLRFRRRSRIARRRVGEFFAPCRECRRRRGARHLLCSQSRHHHGFAALARGDSGLDAGLWHAASDDGAGSAGR